MPVGTFHYMPVPEASHAEINRKTFLLAFFGVIALTCSAVAILVGVYTWPDQVSYPFIGGAMLLVIVGGVTRWKVSNLPDLLPLDAKGLVKLHELILTFPELKEDAAGWLADGRTFTFDYLHACERYARFQKSRVPKSGESS